MKTLKRILAATTLLVTLGFASEANAQVPLENFFKNPEKGDTKSHRWQILLIYMAPYENPPQTSFVQEVGSDKSNPIALQKRYGILQEACGQMGHRILYKRYCRRREFQALRSQCRRN